MPQSGVDGAVPAVHIQAQAAEAVFFDQPVVVRHDDQRAFSGQFRKQAHDVLRGHGVQRGGGLVGEHELRFRQQRPRYGDPLPFPDGQFVRQGAEQVSDAEASGQFLQSGVHGLRVHALGSARRCHVVPRAQEGEESSGLQHIADMPQPQAGHTFPPPAPPEFRHIFRRIARRVEQELFRRAWGQYHGEQVQRGAFPAARRADQRDFFTGPDGQGFDAEPIRVVPRFPFECDVSQFAEIHRGKFHLCIY